MSVRAKFKVISITRRKGCRWDKVGAMTQVETQSIELQPVTGDTEENKAFFTNTPSGRIELGTVNVEAASQFELDGEYYVDFTPAPKP